MTRSTEATSPLLARIFAVWDAVGNFCHSGADDTPIDCDSRLWDFYDLGLRAVHDRYGLALVDIEDLKAESKAEINQRLDVIESLLEMKRRD